MKNNTTPDESDGRVRALHIAPTPFFSDRGCHMRIRGIISALNRKSVDNILCTYHLGRDIEGIETIRTAPVPGYSKLEAGPSAYKYVADILLLIKVCTQILKRKPDIIHAHLHEGALIGWLARLLVFRRRIPMIFDMQGSLTGELEAHGYFSKFRLLKKMFYLVEYLITRIPDRFICSSENSVNVLIRDFGVKTGLVTLVSDGADLFEPAHGRNTDLELALPENRTMVIYTGALLEAKGIHHLYDAILQASKRGTACHFLIVGYPEEPIREFCDRNGLQEYCTVIGRVPYARLGEYLSMADVAVEPKLSASGEASGKLLNYMGAGLPVVCFDTRVNRQLLGDDGYYVSTDDGIIDGIQAVIRDPANAKVRGIAGQKRVELNYSWDASADRVKTVYRSCLVE